MISTMNNALNNTLLLSHQKILKGNGYFKYIVKYCSHTSINSNKFLIIYAIKWLKNSTEISSSIKPRYHAVATRLNVILPATASQLMEKYLDGNFYLFFSQFYLDFSIRKYNTKTFAVGVSTIARISITIYINGNSCC